jgi:hypothetical protein
VFVLWGNKKRGQKILSSGSHEKNEVIDNTHKKLHIPDLSTFLLFLLCFWSKVTLGEDLYWNVKRRMALPNTLSIQ